MDSAVAKRVSGETWLFQDGLGERILVRDPQAAQPVDLLRLRPDLTGIPAVEYALGEQVRRLTGFRDAAFTGVRRLDRLADAAPAYAIVSDHVQGRRLHEVLEAAERTGLRFDINAALGLVRQIVSAMARLHRQAREASHGALGPERIILTPEARPVIADYVLGPALEQLRLSHDRYWSEFRIAVPPSAGPPRFDQRADVAQIGMTALALVLGRPLREDERLRTIVETLAAATQTRSGSDSEPLSPGVRSWLARALQVDPRRSFVDAIEAESALDEALAADQLTGSPEDVQAFLRRCQPPARPPIPRAAGRAPETPIAPARPSWNSRSDTSLARPWHPVAAPARHETPADRPPSRAGIVFAILLVAAGGGLEVVRTYSEPPAQEAPRPLVLEVQPQGIEVVVDGQSRGIGPVTVSVEPGSHTIRLRARSERVAAAGSPRGDAGAKPPSKPAARIASVSEPPGHAAEAGETAAPAGVPTQPLTASEPPAAVAPPSYPASAL